jgi:hypothetical protein
MSKASSPQHGKDKGDGKEEDAAIGSAKGNNEKEKDDCDDCDDATPEDKGTGQAIT